MSSVNTPDKFEQFLISEYFNHGSIDAVLKFHNYSIPTSFATYHRILDKYGIVKSAGPNSKLSESLHVLSLLNGYKEPLERVYHKYAPSTIKASTNTLHRVLHNIRLGVTRREGTALLVSTENEPNKYLVAQDTSLKNNRLGNEGDYSLPMAHTRTQDSHTKSIKRVMQQEMFTKECIKNEFPSDFIPQDPKPFLYINIADIRVGVFRILIPATSHSFSSPKLVNFSFKTHEQIEKLTIRPGLEEIINHHEHYRFNPSQEPVTINSNLNQEIYNWALEKQQI